MRTATYGGMEMFFEPHESGETRKKQVFSGGFLGSGAGAEEITEVKVRVYWQEPGDGGIAEAGEEREGMWWHSSYGLVRDK